MACIRDGHQETNIGPAEVNITTLNQRGILCRLFIHFYLNRCIRHLNFYPAITIAINSIHIETGRLIDLDCIALFDITVIRLFQTDGPAVTPSVGENERARLSTDCGFCPFSQTAFAIVNAQGAHGCRLTPARINDQKRFHHRWSVT
ncbi:hypothetical protein PQR02_07340 [Paraburkholderia sediminicola]|uniref:Uncharacterized protein n=1 Tax=Paraburkholderia rhynchosiae TaxID=487049 RepID=A0ACC7N367_9BURK